MRRLMQKDDGNDFVKIGLILFCLWMCLLTPAQAVAQQKNDTLPAKPVRLLSAAIPATIAFTSHDALWLMDGRNVKQQPIRLTFQGIVELVDWSPSGEWLAFLRYPSEMKRDQATLWVTRQDGHVVQQVDQGPVLDTPQWSPVENTLVYRTRDDVQKREGWGKIARITQNGTIEGTTIWEPSAKVVDFAWEPNGKCLAIALPRTTTEPLRIDQLCLNGLRKTLVVHPSVAPVPDGIYMRNATAMKWSPDGRYLSYFQFLSGASLSADNMPLFLLDMFTGKSRMIGNGLGYRDWLTWSPDSRWLAFSQGSNRMVTTNKRLTLFDTQTGKSIDLGKNGFVDTSPVWAHPTGRPDAKTTPKSSAMPHTLRSELLFQRGVETDWPTCFDPPRVVIPGQRIWRRTVSGEQLPVTAGPSSTADYMPQVSPDGKSLLFLRLNTYRAGSLYIQPLENKEPVEVVKGILGRNHGFYGNYLPTWVKVYWRGEVQQTKKDV